MERRYLWLADELRDRAYLVGDRFTIADAYLFTVNGWGAFIGFDLGRWPVIGEYQQRIAARPAVQAALRAEGCNVLDDTESSDFGKFGWVVDPDGNKIELWEPPAGQ